MLVEGAAMTSRKLRREVSDEWRGVRQAHEAFNADLSFGARVPGSGLANQKVRCLQSAFPKLITCRLLPYPFVWLPDFGLRIL